MMRPPQQAGSGNLSAASSGQAPLPSSQQQQQQHGGAKHRVQEPHRNMLPGAIISADNDIEAAISPRQLGSDRLHDARATLPLGHQETRSRGIYRERPEEELLQARPTPENEGENSRKREANELDRTEDSSYGPVFSSVLPDSHKSIASGSTRFLRKFYDSPASEAVICTVAILNAVNIGFEAAYATKHHHSPATVNRLELAFLAFYGVSICLQLRARGFSGPRAVWTIFDITMLFMGVALFILDSTNGGDPILHSIKLIRLLRLASIFTTPKPLPRLETPWRLAKGFRICLQSLLWTSLLVLITVYSFSVLGMELIQSTSDLGRDYETVARESFKDVGTTTLTLMQFITIDGIYRIYRPLITARPSLLFYFGTFVSIMCILFLNLVATVTVDVSQLRGTRHQIIGKTQQAQGIKELALKLKQILSSFDDEKCGELEMIDIVNAPRQQVERLTQICSMDEIERVFQILDYDKSGSVKIDDFTRGLVQLWLDQTPELIRVVHQCGSILNHCRRIDRKICGEESLGHRHGQPSALTVGSRSQSSRDNSRAVSLS